NAKRQSAAADGRRARGRHVAHYLSRRNAQHDGRAAPSLQDGDLSPRGRVPRGRAGAGLDRQSQPRPAQGRGRAGAASVRGADRRAASSERGRGQAGLPRPLAGRLARSRARGGPAMTADRTLLLLLAGCLGILVVSTAGTYLLRLKLAGGPQNALIENLTERVNAWWVMVVVLGTAMLIGKAAVIPLFALISFQALREFITLTNTRRGDHWALVATFFVATPIQYGLIWFAQ